MTPMLLSGALVADELPENVRPGWTALVIVFAMGVALALLMWSMVRQFRKVDFEEKPDEPEDSDAAQEPSDEHEINGSPH